MKAPFLSFVLYYPWYSKFTLDVSSDIVSTTFTLEGTQNTNICTYVRCTYSCPLLLLLLFFFFRKSVDEKTIVIKTSMLKLKDLAYDFSPLLEYIGVQKARQRNHLINGIFYLYATMISSQCPYKLFLQYYSNVVK
jgi:hypothetical protein